MQLQYARCLYRWWIYQLRRWTPRCHWYLYLQWSKWVLKLMCRLMVGSFECIHMLLIILALTWSQPASLDPSTTLPWTPRIPASSNCVTFSSAELYGGSTASVGATSAMSSIPAGSLTTLPPQASGSKATGSKGSSTGTAGGPSSTNGAGRLVASSALFALLGVVVVFL